MPKRLRLTRRMNIAMTEDAFRRLRRFASEAGLDAGVQQRAGSAQAV